MLTIYRLCKILYQLHMKWPIISATWNCILQCGIADLFFHIPRDDTMQQIWFLSHLIFLYCINSNVNWFVVRNRRGIGTNILHFFNDLDYIWKIMYIVHGNVAHTGCKCVPSDVRSSCTINSITWKASRKLKFMVIMDLNLGWSIRFI